MKSKNLLIIAALALVISAGSIVIPNFIRARNTPASNACINTLRNMDGAMQQWTLEQTKRPGDAVTIQDITPYMAHKFYCPQGGKYTVGPFVSNGVSCSFPTHTLPK